MLRAILAATVIAWTGLSGCSRGGPGKSSLTFRLRGTDVAGINCHFTAYVNETKIGTATATQVDADYTFQVPMSASAIERVYVELDNNINVNVNRKITLSTLSIDDVAVPLSQFVIYNLDGTSLQTDNSVLIGYKGLQVIRKCRPGMVLGSAGCYPAALDGDFIASIAAHPRLMLTDARLKVIQDSYLAKSDPTLNSYVDDILKQVENNVSAGLPVYTSGVVLLGVTQQAQRVIYLEAFGYRWFKTSDPTKAARYAKAAKAQMTSLADFTDWHPAHFLDTAEAAHAMAIGLDWTYDYLSAAERSRFADAIASKALAVAKSYFDQPATAPWWVNTATNNWRDVCHGGLTIGALAMAESNPDLARSIIRYSVTRLTLPPFYYVPNGALREGPSYGDYTANYDATVATALETAIGSDLTLKQLPCLSCAGDFIIDETGTAIDERVGAAISLFNYGDAWNPYRVSFSPVMMFLGAYDTAYSDAEHTMISTRHKLIQVKHLIWYHPPTGQVRNRPTSHYFMGVVESFVARSSWSDPDALFVGFKAGANNAEHVHFDSGNFIVDALGQRWAMDLGPESYDITCPDEGCYRIISKGHNVPLFGGNGQVFHGNGEMTRTQGDSPSPYAIVDLTSAYDPDTVSSYQRGIRMIDGKSVLIQDEFLPAAPCDVEWGMLTEATVDILSPTEALLTLNGKALTMEILPPSNATFTVESAVQTSPQTANAGISRITALVPADAGATRLAIQLKPNWSSGEPAANPPVISLSSW